MWSGGKGYILIWASYFVQGTLWSWSYCSLIYNYLCNQCISPLKLWVRISLRRGVLDTALCDKACPGTPVSSTSKTDRHDINEILLKVELSIITLTLTNPFNLYSTEYDSRTVPLDYHCSTMISLVCTWYTNFIFHEIWF